MKPAQNMVLILFSFLIVLFAIYILITVIFSSHIDLSNFINQLALPSYNKFNRIFLISAMVLLPPLGVPISIFLVLIGIQFGVATGILLTVLILPLHMTICYSITHTFMRDPLIKFLSKRGWKPPLLHSQRPGLAMIGFLLMPGPPYALKTYLLALTGLPFPIFLLVNWSTECIITLPIVAMSGAASEQNWFLFGLVLVIFVLCTGLRWFKRNKNSRL